MKKLLLIALIALTLPASNLVAEFISISDAMDMAQAKITDQTKCSQAVDSILAAGNDFGMIDRDAVTAIVESMVDQPNDDARRMRDLDESLALAMEMEENHEPQGFGGTRAIEDPSIALARRLQQKEEADVRAQNEQAGLQLALQLHKEEQMVSDAALTRLLHETSYQTHELETRETEGHFSYVGYRYNPASSSAAHIGVQKLLATPQHGNTCGIHTVVNAQAINQCLTSGQSVANLRNFHGGIYANAISGIRNMQNLSTQEVLELSQKLGINNFYALATAERQYILVKNRSTQPFENALAELKRQPAGIIHFGLHVGNHWVLLSIVKERGNTYLSFADSANGSPANAQHYINFVNDTFMK